MGADADPRDPEEPRSSTSLELLFDLIFAVAVSQSADGFQEMFLEGEIGYAVRGLFFTFFALWWPWANYAVFASAYDNDDIRFRIYVFVQMIGSLFIAQGIKQAYHRDLTIMVIGYVILRVAQLTMWYLVSRHDKEHGKFAIRQVISLSILQTIWCLGMAMNIILDRPEWYQYVLIVGVALELGAYAICERGAKPHPIHMEHMVDRFGEFTLIVLGETVLSWSVSLNESSLLTDYHPSLGMIAAAAFLGTISLWWTYFDFPFEDVHQGKAKLFGLAHYFVFVGITAFGASIRIAIAAAEGESEAPRCVCVCGRIVDGIGHHGSLGAPLLDSTVCGGYRRKVRCAHFELHNALHPADLPRRDKCVFRRHNSLDCIVQRCAHLLLCDSRFTTRHDCMQGAATNVRLHE